MAYCLAVRPAGGDRTWTVVDVSYATVGPVEEWLKAHRHLWSPNTVRGYATSLAQWWSFLEQRGEGGQWTEPGCRRYRGCPGTGKTHLATGLAIRACQAGAPGRLRHRRRLGRPPRRRPPRRAAAGRAHPPRPLPAPGDRRGGLHPFEPEAASLFFQLVSSRYERASLIVTSNKQFGRWVEVFGDDVVDSLISTQGDGRAGQRGGVRRGQVSMTCCGY